MTTDSVVNRGLVLVVLPDETDRQWVVSALEGAGFTVTQAAFDTVADMALQREPQLIFLECDHDQGVPDPLPILRKMGAGVHTPNILVVLVISEEHAAEIWKDHTEWKQWNLHLTAIMRNPRIKNFQSVYGNFMLPENLVNWLDWVTAIRSKQI